MSTLSKSASQLDRGWYDEGGKELKQFQVGMDVSGTITNIFRSRIWVDIGAQREASMVLSKRIANHLQVGDPLSGCFVMAIDAEKGLVSLDLRSESTSTRERARQISSACAAYRSDSQIVPMSPDTGNQLSGVMPHRHVYVCTVCAVCKVCATQYAVCTQYVQYVSCT